MFSCCSPRKSALLIKAVIGLTGTPGCNTTMYGKCPLVGDDNAPAHACPTGPLRGPTITLMCAALGPLPMNDSPINKEISFFNVDRWPSLCLAYLDFRTHIASRPDWTFIYLLMSYKLLFIFCYMIKSNALSKNLSILKSHIDVLKNSFVLQNRSP